MTKEEYVKHVFENICCQYCPVFIFCNSPAMEYKNCEETAAAYYDLGGVKDGKKISVEL